MRFRWLFCLPLLACSCTTTPSATSAGTATTKTPLDLSETWMQMVYQPVERFPRETLAHTRIDFDNPSASFGEDEGFVYEPWHKGGPGFSVCVRYGPYTVWTTERPGDALLLDAEDKPVWAGNYVIPLRIDGQVQSLLLATLIDRTLTSHHSWMYRLIRLDFAGEPHIIETYDEREDIAYLPWPVQAMVVDIDFDGTDEFWTLRPQPVASQYKQVAGIHQHMTQLRWEIWLRAKPSDHRLFVDEQDRPPATRTYDLSEVIEIPPTLRDISFELSSWDHSLIFIGSNSAGERVPFAKVQSEYEPGPFKVEYLMEWERIDTGPPSN